MGRLHPEAPLFCTRIFRTISVFAFNANAESVYNDNKGKS